jgi:hypothetical protein
LLDPQIGFSQQRCGVLLRTIHFGIIVDKVTLEQVNPSASHIHLLAKETIIVGPFEIAVVSTPLCSIGVFFGMLYSDLKLNILL